jgi:endonuclease IV
MAKDIYHQIVKEALEKDGWLITHDPYLLNRNSKSKPYEIDLGAEKILIAERGVEHIAV